MNTFSIAIHGGAGTLIKGLMTPELEDHYRNTLKVARDAGFEILKSGGTAIDAVETAVKLLGSSTTLQFLL